MRRALPGIVLPLLLVGGAAGCYEPRLSPCTVRCGDAGACPAGLECAGGFCIAPGGAHNRAIAGGAGYTLHLREDGRIHGWGRVPGYGLRERPSLLAGLPGGVAEIAAGAHHACLRAHDGRVECFGLAEDGQIGVEVAGEVQAPQQVTGLGVVAEVAAGHHFSCARGGGVVSCWGANVDGELGADPGVLPRSATPSVVPLPRSARSIACGMEHACAVLDDGTVWCWGRNDLGQLGAGAPVGSRGPVAVPGITTAAAVAAGRAHSCVLDDRGLVSCWGEQGNPAVGHAGATGEVAVVALPRVTRLRSSLDHCVALAGDGALHTWGVAGWGRLGREGYDQTPGPIASPIVDWSDFTAGHEHTCAITADSVWCVGSNESGELGTGQMTIEVFTPVEIAVGECD